MKSLILLTICLTLATFAHSHTITKPGYGYDKMRAQSLKAKNLKDAALNLDASKVPETAGTTAPLSKAESLPAEEQPAKEQTAEEKPVEEQPASQAPAKEETAVPAEPKSTDESPAKEAFKCDHIHLFHSGYSSEELCHLAKTECEGDFGNFYNLYYCSFDQSMAGLIIFYMFIIFLIFRYTATVVDEYIAEGITNISEAMGLSESLAAVTVLAFANGAGDVITALVSSGAEGGVSYNIGALYGAGLFVVAMVVAICIFIAPKPPVFDKMIIYRDIGIYIIATIITCLFAVAGWIYWWMAVILLIVYVCLVLVVVIEERMNPAKTSEVEEVPKEEELATTLNPSGEGEPEDDTNNIFKRMISMKRKEIITEIDSKKHVDSSRLFAQLFAVAGIGSFLRAKQMLIFQHKKKTFWDLTIIQKLMKCVDVPCEWLFYLTCTAVSEDDYDYGRLMVWPVPGVYLFFYTFTKEWYGMSWLYVGLPVVAVIYALFFFTLKKNEAPRWHMVFTCIGVINGLMYTYIFVGFLIDMLNTLGVLLGLDNTYLGLTILAVGNALPDALTTIAFCKQGYTTMAISGGIAGQLFGLLVGFGLSMLKQTLIAGPQEFGLYDPAQIDSNLLDLIVLGTALVILSFTFVWGVTHGFVMNKTFAGLNGIIYFVFIIASSVIAIRKAVINY